MVEAGAAELDLDTVQDLLDGFTNRYVVAQNVFRAMIRVLAATQKENFRA